MSTTKLGENFMKIPWLDVTGTNWIIYKDCFLWAIDMRRHLDHIDSSMEEPVDPNLGHEDKTKALTTAEAAVELEWKKELKIWKQEEAIIKQQITTMIPDSLFMKIQGKGTALEIWSSLVSKFKKKSWLVAMDWQK